MKLNKMSHAVALACLGLGASTVSHAYAPTSQADADYVIYFGGATASNLTLRTTIVEQICDAAQPGGIDELNVGPRVSPNGWAIACTTTSARVPGLAISPARMIFVKTNLGGSATGVNPVEQETNLNFMDVSTGGATPNCATPTPQSSPAGVAFTSWACGGTTVAVPPDGGTSDIEPNKFFGINTTAGSEPFKNLGNLSVFSVAHLLFNTPVTLELRNALQRTQFPQTSVCHPANAAYKKKPDGTPAVGDAPITEQNAESEACMPSLSYEHVRSIMSGRVTNWNQLLVKRMDAAGNTIVDGGGNPVYAGLYTEAVTNQGAPAQTDTNTQICRRVNGSGTQAQFNAIVMGWPCDRALDVLVPAAASNPFGGPKVVLNSGSGDVRRCLNAYNNGNDGGMTNPVKPDAVATKRWAIGVQSLENNPSLADQYRFIKLNGAAPTLANAFNGSYDDWAAQSIQWRTNETTFAYGKAPLGNAAKGADIKTIFNFIKDRWITVNSIVDLNVSYKHSFGQSGWLLEPSTTLVPDARLNLNRPVNQYTRRANHCQMPVRWTATTSGTGIVIFE